MPRNPKFVFQRFYDDLKERGFVIYPGKLTVADSFRIGCIGRLYPEHMRAALDAVRDVLRDMDVELAPSVAA
jgi:2-aminoethylphosphonate-pyruvate transaminase